MRDAAEEATPTRAREDAAIMALLLKVMDVKAWLVL
jgi:hypothetical protein